MSKVQYPERLVPEHSFKGIVSNSLIRYQFVSGYAGGKNVLDVGCGAGYGSSFLSKYARHVTGIDRSTEAVTYAQEKYKEDNVTFAEMDAETFAFKDKFDIICCFEAIEHFDHPRQHLSQVARHLAQDGVYVVSTPNCFRTKSGSDNPYHRWEFNRRGLEGLLREFFEDVEVMGEYRLDSFMHFILQKADFLKLRQSLIPRSLRRGANKLLGSTSIEDMELHDLKIGKECAYKWTELVCVCKKPKHEL